MYTDIHTKFKMILYYDLSNTRHWKEALLLTVIPVEYTTKKATHSYPIYIKPWSNSVVVTNFSSYISVIFIIADLTVQFKEFFLSSF